MAAFSMVPLHAVAGERRLGIYESCASSSLFADALSARGKEGMT